MADQRPNRVDRSDALRHHGLHFVEVRRKHMPVREGLAPPKRSGPVARMQAAISRSLNLISWRGMVWRLMPVRVTGEVPQGGPILLTADHRSLWDGPLLAVWLTRPTLFAVHGDYGRHWFWSHAIRFWCQLWGHRFVVVSEKAPFGFRTLLGATEESLVCLFPEGRISRDSIPCPWKAGVFSLLKRRPDFKHCHLAIASSARMQRIPFWQSGFDWAIRAVPILFDAQPPVRTWVPQGNGIGFVPSASGGKASTEMISDTRL